MKISCNPAREKLLMLVLAIALAAGSAQASSITFYVATGSAVTKYTQSGNSAPTAAGTLSPTVAWTNAFALTTDTSGDIYVSDAGANRVVEFNSSGTQISSFTLPADSSGGNISPQEIALDSSGNLYTTSYGGAVYKFASGTGARTTIQTISGARGILVDNSNGTTYVDTSGVTGAAAYSFATGTSNTPTDIWNAGSYPNGQLRGMTYDTSGDLFIADSTWVAGSGDIEKITSGGTKSTFETGLNGPNALAIGPSTNVNNDLFVVDYFGGDIREYNPSTGAASGINSGVFLSGLTNPTGILFAGVTFAGGEQPQFMLSDVFPVPEPATTALFLGALGIVATKLSRRKKA